jgi:hypothetical protein
MQFLLYLIVFLFLLLQRLCRGTTTTPSTGHAFLIFNYKPKVFGTNVGGFEFNLELQLSMRVVTICTGKCL